VIGERAEGSCIFRLVAKWLMLLLLEWQHAETTDKQKAQKE
jgi:hypothetical protein